MKTIVLFIGCSLPVACAAQFSINDLGALAELPVQKFDAHIIKKEYRRDYNSPRESRAEYAYYQQQKPKSKKKEQVMHTLSYKSAGPLTDVCFQTSSKTEKEELFGDLRRAGFVQHEPGQNAVASLYQKSEYTVAYSEEIKDTVLLYTFLLQRKALPKLKDIAYAEDLLNFSSHEYLRSSFGNSAVREDVFYYSESETNKCTVLFPGTEREVIFVWSDEQNLRKPAFLLVGGHLKPDNSLAANRQIRHNVWRSKQGVYAGMSLRELEDVNNGAVKFYGWHTDQAGMLLTQNSGALNFKELGVVLNCINCDGETKAINVVSSSQAIQQSQRVHVATLVILPQKESGTAAVQH